MQFGYLRVYADEREREPLYRKMLSTVGDDRFIFSDIRSKSYERKNYQFLCSMLRSGDVLFVDSLDSLGRTLEDMVKEWRRLTEDVGVDVVVLDETFQLDSRRFRAQGKSGREMEQEVLDTLLYVAQLQKRKMEESRRLNMNSGLSGNNYGRPPLQLDWELFHKTARRWADGEISVEEACKVTGTARSSWYKYTREAGYVRGNKRTKKKSTKELAGAK